MYENFLIKQYFLRIFINRNIKRKSLLLKTSLLFQVYSFIQSAASYIFSRLAFSISKSNIFSYCSTDRFSRNPVSACGYVLINNFNTEYLNPSFNPSFFPSVSPSFLPSALLLSLRHVLFSSLPVLLACLNHG